LLVAGGGDDLPAALRRAEEAIESGAAQRTLETLVRVSNG
jgi:anthranilate phosphoribosyltransferase